ncbi:MAG: hypothetical protein PHI85_05005 [Victivallaceae bacterium]|nr:hypothetical protein [Victivallaceae bacterium]
MEKEINAPDCTIHAVQRIKQRNIPEVFLGYAISNGKRTFIADRGTIEYRVRNILGIRGRSLVVITDKSGVAITSYIDR